MSLFFCLLFCKMYVATTHDRNYKVTSLTHFFLSRKCINYRFLASRRSLLSFVLRITSVGIVYPFWAKLLFLTVTRSTLSFLLLSLGLDKFVCVFFH